MPNKTKIEEQFLYIHHIRMMIRLNLCYEMYAYSIIFGGQPSYNIFSQNVVTFFYPRILIIMVPQIQVRNIRQLTAQFLGQMSISSSSTYLKYINLPLLHLLLISERLLLSHLLRNATIQQDRVNKIFLILHRPLTHRTYFRT